MSNFRLLTDKQLEVRKKKYPPGTRIELVNMNDPFTKLAAGEHGTIIDVDCFGDLEVDWDCGSSLKIIFGEDSFKVL